MNNSFGRPPGSADKNANVGIPHDPTAPRQMLKRYLGSWHQRLAVGLHLAHDFRAVEASLVLCKGYGKWLQHQWTGRKIIEVPQELAAACIELRNNASASIAELSQLKQDLGDAFVKATEAAVSLSGKAADRLLTIGVIDPGYWSKDFDGQVTFDSFCASEILAEQTGLTVIDNFPGRDIATMGCGQCIDLLALWLLFAERNPTISTTCRILIRSGLECELIFLPHSDGLDDELPKIAYRKIEIPRSASELLEQLEDFQTNSIRSDQRLGDDCQIEHIVFGTQAVCDSTIDHLRQNELSVADQLCSGVDSSSINSTLAATLSLMALDQMPATLPWIHGSDSPRTLGRITPGSPNNWRQVILNMADFRPPAMKLRDAI